jgi:CRISPR/Cas system-associated protein endoribonuclease Cas2
MPRNKLRQNANRLRRKIPKNCGVRITIKAAEYYFAAFIVLRKTLFFNPKANHPYSNKHLLLGNAVQYLGQSQFLLLA